MGLIKALLRALGLSNEARVKITAPGIEVELTGDPERVSALLGVVKAELEKGRGRRGARRVAAGRRRPAAGPTPATDSKVVRPTELDEMDSPYALPEAVVVPVPDDDDMTTDEQRVHPRRAQLGPPEPTTVDPDTDIPAAFTDGPSEQTVGLHDDVPPDDETTAVSPNPSGQVQIPRRVSTSSPSYERS